MCWGEHIGVDLPVAWGKREAENIHVKMNEKYHSRFFDLFITEKKLHKVIERE